MTEPFDASEPAAVRERNNKLKLRERERLAAVGAIMEHKQTRAWVHDLLTRGHVFETSFHANPQVTAFKEGERNIALQVLADVTKASPDGYAMMMKEANRDE